MHSIVVGYQEIGTPQGFSMRNATFRGVSGGAYKMKDIKVTSEDICGYGDICVQRCNADGSWGDSYYWLTMDGAMVEDGWYMDAVGEIPVDDDVILNAGEGLFLTSTDVSLELVIAGEVANGSTSVDCPCGFSMIGNPTPVTVSLNQVTVSSDVIVGYGDVCIQKCNADGSWGDMFYWLTMDGALVDDGWYMDAVGEISASEVTLEPGDSVFATSTDADAVFTFPSVL